MGYTKEDALRIVLDGATKYQQHLCGKMLLFVCSDKLGNVTCYEVYFGAANFQHLTGIVSSTDDIRPVDFYERCIARRLSVSDIEFVPNGSTQLKLEVLPSLMCPNLNAKMLGDFNNMGQLLYTEKLAGGIKYGIGFRYAETEQCNIPNTLLNGDMRNLMKNQRRILATFRKNKDEAIYSEMVYLAKDVILSTVPIPAEYAYLKK